MAHRNIHYYQTRTGTYLPLEFVQLPVAPFNVLRNSFDLFTLGGRFSHTQRRFGDPTFLFSKQHDGENTTKTKTTRRRQNPHDGDTMHTMQAKSTHRETILRFCVKLSPSAEIQVGSP